MVKETVKISSQPRLSRQTEQPTDPKQSMDRHARDSRWRARWSVSLMSVWLIATVVVALLWGFEFRLLQEDKDEAYRRASVVAGVMADSLAQRAQRVLQTADALTLLVRSDYDRDPAGFRFEEAWTRPLISGDTITSVSVVGTDGRVLLSTLGEARGTDVRDDDYIRHPLDSGDAGLYVGKRRTGRVMGDLVVPVSRRLSPIDGSPGGVVVVAQSALAFVDDVTDGGGLSGGNVLAVYRSQDDGAGGALLAARVGSEPAPVRWARLSAYRDAGEAPTEAVIDPGDGVRRILARRSVTGYPVEVIAGISERDALMSYRDTRNARLVIAAVATLVLVAFFLIIGGLMRRLLGSGERLRRIAESDSLSRAFNRHWLDARLDAWFASGDRLPLALLYVDMNGFKQINDCFGHATGDVVLTKMADRLRALVGKTGEVARVGGDEFCVVLEAASAFGEAQALTARIREDLAMPFVVSGHVLAVSVCMGGALALEVNDSRSALLRRADLAMYEAKRNESGSGSVCFYTPELDDRANAMKVLSHDLRNAIARHEIYAALEPIVDLSVNSVIGYEVMARWRHPERGDVPARMFIELAEADGYVGAISECVFDLACARLAELEASSERELLLSFNLSSAEFLVEDLAARVVRRAQVHGVVSCKIQLEIPDGCLREDPLRVATVLAGLRESGVRVALSGFGESASRFQQLIEQPLTALQVPAAFVAGAPGDRRRAGVVQSMAVLARGMDCDVIVQGVETVSQHEWLSSLGRVWAQGSFYHIEHAVRLMPEAARWDEG